MRLRGELELPQTGVSKRLPQNSCLCARQTATTNRGRLLQVKKSLCTAVTETDFI